MSNFDLVVDGHVLDRLAAAALLHLEELVPLRGGDWVQGPGRCWSSLKMWFAARSS